MEFTKEEVQEMMDFDYASLFNEEIEEVQEETKEEVASTLVEVKITPTPQDMRHHLARLTMMMMEERGESISYEKALSL